MIAFAACTVDNIITNHSAARVVLFSVVPVCVFVCLSVCQHDGRDIITKFRNFKMVERADKFWNIHAGHHPMVKRADKFEASK